MEGCSFGCFLFSTLTFSKFRAQLCMNSLTHCNLIFLMCNVRLVVSSAAQSSWYHSRAKAHALLCVVPDTQHSIKYVLIFIGIYLLYNFVFFLLYGKVNQLYVYICVVVQSPSCVQLFATPWSAAEACNRMDCSRSGLPVPHHLLEFAQVHVHCIGDAVQPSCPLKPSSSALDLPQHQGLFQWLPLLFWFPSHLGHRRALSTLPCAI